MKTTLLTAAAMLLSFGAPAVRAQEPAPAALPPAKCPMCEMMKKKAAAKPQMDERVAELDKLVTEMNGSIGPRKIEAMAAVITRLVEQYKMQAKSRPAPPPTPPKEETHQH
jgi:hypothetical protein